MIKLYYEPQFRPDKNMYVDGLADYLADITPLWEVQDFQYIKHDLDITVKISWNQEGVGSLPFNYAVIQNDDEEPFYYWIIDSKWLAQETLALRLAMDTVNSLGQGEDSFANPRNLSAETQIMRQHMDRYEKQFYWNPSLGGTLTRKIHRTPEGLTLNQEKVDDIIISDTDFEDMSWYLIYRTEGENDKVVATYLAPETKLPFVGREGGGTIFDSSNMQSGVVYKLTNEFPFTITIYEKDGTETQYSSAQGWNTKVYTFPSNSAVPGFRWVSPFYGAEFTVKDSSTLEFTGIPGDVSAGGIPYPNFFPEAGLATNNPITTPRDITGFKIDSGSKMFVDGSEQPITQATEIVDLYMNSINELDRTDPKIVKIIKLPYCPIQFLRDNPQWEVADAESGLPGFLTYKGNFLPLLGKEGFAEIDLTPEMRRVVGANDIREDSRKNYENESKLFHSEFHTVKAVYDSFSYPIEMERFSYLQPSTETVPVSFKPTSTVNSKMGFRFLLENAGTYHFNQDFGEYLLITRNNEDVILNSEYINYIKNGINYDKKANAIAAETALRNASLGTATTIASLAAAGASFAATTATGGASIASGIGLSATAASSAASTWNAWANLSTLRQTQENSMKQKITQLQLQAASVAGTDDIDLMTWYSNNRLHVMRYDLPDYARDTVYNYFDILGYKIDKYEVPNVDSRIWYNFLQCDPVFKQQGTGKLKQAWLDDLRARYNGGITVYHNRNGVYNFEQRYENWEKWIVDGSN